MAGKINIDRLYDYTKFHIGIYATLVTAAVGVVKLLPEDTLEPSQIVLVSIGAICFAIAGAFGGIVCTNCLRYGKEENVDDDSRATFWSDAYAPLTLRQAADAEHLAFWIGIVVVLATFGM